MISTPMNSQVDVSVSKDKQLHTDDVTPASNMWLQFVAEANTTYLNNMAAKLDTHH